VESSGIYYFRGGDVNIARIEVALAVPGEQPESSAYVGWNWDAYLPAFKDAKGVFIPFRPTGICPPLDYQGDFYVAEFTDAKIKQAWLELKAKNSEAAKQIMDGVWANSDEIEPGRCRNTGDYNRLRRSWLILSMAGGVLRKRPLGYPIKAPKGLMRRIIVPRD
jgi:hypothetical protein